MTGELPIAIENSVYRIIQEGLINTAKHASASHAEIEVRQTDHNIVFSVRDDGVGFDGTMKFRIRRPGLGLTEIRERVDALGGVLRLGLHGEGGTDMTIEIPLGA
jgi:signal transduction histidine kinase